MVVSWAKFICGWDLASWGKVAYDPYISPSTITQPFCEGLVNVPCVIHRQTRLLNTVTEFGSITLFMRKKVVYVSLWYKRFPATLALIFYLNKKNHCLDLN